MYKINELAKLAGISTRTLRYYDKIQLLTPSKIDQNGYRYYNDREVDILQQILFYKELGYSLSKITLILHSTSYNQLESLHEHLIILSDKKSHIENVMGLVTKTIENIERGKKMTDKEKFEAFKLKQINENTEKYGVELDKKYDPAFMEQANQQYLKKSKYQMKEQENLTKKLNDTIIMAMKTNDPSSPIAQRMCELHKEWICFYWPSYDKKHHLSLVKMYTLDERFTKYYDKICVGAAHFLYSAMKRYVEQ